MNKANKRWVREVMGKHMSTLADKNDKVIAVSADLFRACRMEKFMEKYPNRTYNVGIAEQNMIGFSAGLAHEGFMPYAFSMASFLTMRACEQCRTDVAYGNLNVRLMGVYAGLSGGLSGATHWSFEDCAIMTSMPNMLVLEPSDGLQVQRMMDATLDWNGPVYMRISVIPALSMYSDMDEKGKVANAAFLVSAASLLAAHMGFTISMEPELLGALIGGKLSGGIAAFALVIFLY